MIIAVRVGCRCGHPHRKLQAVYGEVNQVPSRN